MFAAFYLFGSMRAFLYRRSPLQQKGHMRKRDGRENCMYVECSQSQGHTFPSPSPLAPPPPRCDKRGSWPALHFLPLTPTPSPPPLDYGQILAASLKVEDCLYFGDCKYDSWQKQWSYTNFRLRDRTLRSRNRIFEFSQEMMKICAAAKNLDTRVNIGMSSRYNQPVQYGRDTAHKSRAAWAGIPLGVYMSERQHIYEDLNKSSSARPGGSQQL